MQELASQAHPIDRARPARGSAPNRARPVVAAALGIATLFATAPVRAQDADGDDPFSGVEEMIVVGTGGAAALLTANSKSVTAFDADTLGDLGVADISDLSDFTPNLEIVKAGTTSPTLFIRGVGLNDFSAAAAGAIAVYEDGVPRNSSAIQLGRVFDVEGVAVEKGPQGRGPYRNASGGAIKVLPRKPSGGFGGYATAQYGRFDFVDFEGAVESPIVPDLLAARVAFGFTDRGGWIRNRCAGAPPIEDRVPRAPGGLPTDPQWSYCGESIANAGDISEVPEGLPKWMNGIRNGSLRGILSFTPDAPMDPSFHLNLHGARVEDDSYVGQALGTRQNPILLDPTGPARGLFPANPNVQNEWLGGTDALGYRDRDVANDRRRIARSVSAACNASGTCQPGFVGKEANRLLGLSVVDLDQDPWTGDYNRAGETRMDRFGGVLRGAFSLTEDVELLSITGFESWDRETDNDFDFSPNVNFERLVDDDGRQWTQELRLTGGAAGDGPFRWEVGGLLLYEELTELREFVFSEGANGILGQAIRDFDQRTISGLVYVDFEVELSEFFTLELGGRYNYERKEGHYDLTRAGLTAVDNIDNEWDHPTGGVSLRYEPTEDLGFYVSYTHGWKSGTYSATVDLFSGVVVASPERIDAYELGWNLSLFDARLQLRGAVFFYDYFNYQLFTNNQSFGGSPEFVTINASSAENYGAELEATLEPWEGARAFVNFGWLESQFLLFFQRRVQEFREPGAGGNAVVVTQAISNTGNRLLNSPQFTVSIVASQDFDLGRLGIVTLRYNGAWTDDVYFDATGGVGVPNPEGRPVMPENGVGQEAYWLHGLGVDWAFAERAITISGWVRNLENTAYKRLVSDASAFQGTTINFVGMPRTYGITLRYEF